VRIVATPSERDARFARDISIPIALRDTFDATTNTWTLRSHAAVSAALACSALTVGHEPVAAESTTHSTNHIRNTVRAAARDAFPGSRLIAWRTLLESSAHAMATALPGGVAIDLMQDFAAPWALDLALAAIRNRASTDDGARLGTLARTIFLDAAHSETGAISDASLDAAATLSALAANGATQTMDVQSFVALSQTLPHLLVASWYALLTHPDARQQWRSSSDKRNVIDELLRFAGPSRAVFRRAARDTHVGECPVAKDQRVILMLRNANHDPVVFPDADRLDLARDASRHVAFGGGAHVCVGKPIIALALEVATTALLDRLGDTTVIDDVQWLDGFAIRAPSSLVVSS